MRLKSDLHTHTVVSGHAYSTLLENIEFCKNNGIEILGASDHGPSMPHAPNTWYFGNMRVLPRVIDGVTVLRGCEVNIINQKGEVDLDESNMSNVDYMIASLHEYVIESTSSMEKDTEMVLNAMRNHEKIEILGHLGNPNYKIDYEKIVKEARKLNIMIEVNNSSLASYSRPGSKENCKKIVELCKEIGTKIILNSDAHVCFDIGRCEKTTMLIEEVDFPKELIMNEPKKLIEHLKSKGRLEDITLN